MKTIYLYSFLCISLCLHSQNEKKIDSIERLLPIQKDTVKLKSYGALNRLLLKTDTNLSKIYLDSLVLIAKQLDVKKFNSLAFSRLGYYYYYISDYHKAEAYNIKAIKLHRELNLKQPLYKALNVLGIVQKYLGKLEESMESHMESLALKEELGVTGFGLAASYVNIGNLLAELDNFEASDEYYLRANSILKEAGIENYSSQILHNIGVNQDELKNYDKALEYYFKSLEHFRKEKNHLEIAKNLNSIGGVYLKQDSLNKAKKYLKESLELSKHYGEKQMVGLTTKNLGNVYFKEGDFNKALKHFKEASAISIETGTLTRGLNNYQQIAKTYAALGDYNKAYKYSDLHFQKYDSVFKKEKIEQINELEIKYQTEKKEVAIALQEEEIKTLNIQAKNDKLTKTLYGVGMLSFLTISGLLYFGFKQRLKKNKIEREKQEAIYKQEIAFKKKELASQTLHLVQKSTFIQELKENLEKIKKSPELFKVEFRRLVMLLKKEKAEDKDWETFKSYFSEVHNNFDNKLKTIYADITEKEIRLASFLRMNLSTKEIASMLNVLPDSVLKSKYRLKKKLKLDRETDLNQFLNTL
ncbi:tetratricopeptide repeat protein [uncultured Algibacter sp.]|uniref:tetratricopeptide repeat protein n=1 Tax=uncultured Algibacter sp. TaxID=298659 RepID=UPI0026125EB4|nr:tetratricopeptide repeat protein [uncultured Algibacter sp.]